MEPTSDDVKEVYARFGLDYYLAEALHRFIETLPRRGYRFLLPVANGDPPAIVPAATEVDTGRRDSGRHRHFRTILVGALAVAIAGLCVRALWNRIPPGASRQAHRIDPAAYGFYQRARYGPRLTRGSIPYFDKAIAKDPRFAAAHAGLASTYITIALHAEVSPREVMPKARQEAIKALAIDSGTAEGHLDLGVVAATFEWDRAAAEREFRRALELDPNIDGGRPTYALFLAHMGRFDEAIDQIAAFEKGPVGIQSLYASVLYFSRQYTRTIEYCNWALELAPAAEELQFWLGRAYADQSRLAEAIRLIESSRGTDRQKSTGFGILSGLYVLVGRRPEALQLLADVLERLKTQYVSRASIAIAYIGLGDFDNAFAWLDKACFEHDFALSSLKVEPAYDLLRTDPRFQTLLRRVHLD